MNKNVLIMTAASAVIVVGGGIFLLSRSTTTPTSTPTNSTTESLTTDISEVKTLKDFINLTSNQECTFTDKEEASNTGIVYGGTSKMRGDFESEVSSKVVLTHMIADSTNIYIWSDGEVKGFKASRSDIDEFMGQAEGEAMDLSKEVDFSCKAWVVDSSKFTLPTGVDFQDTSEAIKEAADCTVCDNLTGAQKTQCLAALNCN